MMQANRRDFIETLLMSIGAAGVALPGWDTLEAATRKRPRFFAPARFAVLDALAETIMPRTDTPGARDALVPKRIDGLMTSWASPKTQADFTRILDEVEAAAPGFAKLAPAKQLEAASAYNNARMRDPAFGKFKNLVFALYYLSEPGATQELRYEHVPGAWEPSIPVTVDTRGYAHDVNFGGN
jgi:gluconate 2-dehydrogenase gamma chain